MFVCLCRGVTLRQVEDARRGGADTLDQLQRRCGAGTGCGACHDTLRGLLEPQKREQVQLTAELSAA